MRISVRVKPGAKQNAVEERDGVFVVSTMALPVAGKANAAVVEILAERFGVPKSSVRIARGHTSRTKIIEIAAPAKF